MTFLVVALLTDVWWACRVPAELGLQGWRYFAGGIAVTLAFIAGLGSLNALATLASMVIGVVAASTWVGWTFPNDTGPPPLLSVLWGVLTWDWSVLSEIYAGLGVGVVLGTAARHVYLKKSENVAVR